MKLADKRNKHTGQAVTAQNVWNRVGLRDEEGIGTRLNECPTVPLVLAKSANQQTVILLDGSSVPVQSTRFDYPTAKALHRNLVKVPAWWFNVKTRYLKSVPTVVCKMVDLHIRGNVEMAVVKETTITTESLGEGRTLDYSVDCGLSLNISHTIPTYWKEEDDESYD